ncbi:ATP-NAD kinase-like domain-containing protein [Peziza echinospora]|nr:ATP-NAD kinase-like domain-containing protein [Peziza echinospora]
MSFRLHSQRCPRLPSKRVPSIQLARSFSSSPRTLELRSINELPDRVRPEYSLIPDSKLLNLGWREKNPPRNILLIKKPGVGAVRIALLEFARHIHETYPHMNIILEPAVAAALHTEVPFPIYTLPPAPSRSPFPYTIETFPRTPQTSPSTANSPFISTSDPNLPGNELYSLPSTDHPYHSKVDLLATFGGDGTILHAASLFATTGYVPPFLSFSMGTLGFLGEWAWKDYRQGLSAVIESGCKVLRRGRIKVGLYNVKENTRVKDEIDTNAEGHRRTWHAMNEVVLHRGLQAHLVNVSVHINNRLLTTAVADGLILSTPTGSTAYSLSSGGPVLHPSVKALLLTPICPRSLSFRPLVMPHDEDIALRVSDKKIVEVSVDGRRWGALEGGGETEVRVRGEVLEKEDDQWKGGIPCIKGPGKGKVRQDGGEGDGWVGGLKGVLKFNYAFGEED